MQVHINFNDTVLLVDIHYHWSYYISLNTSNVLEKLHFCLDFEASSPGPFPAFQCCTPLPTFLCTTLKIWEKGPGDKAADFMPQNSFVWSFLWPYFSLFFRCGSPLSNFSHDLYSAFRYQFSLLTQQNPSGLPILFSVLITLLRLGGQSTANVLLPHLEPLNRHLQALLKVAKPSVKEDALRVYTVLLVR